MIKINRIKCLQCAAILESKSVHDFVQCECLNETFVDGGHNYQRFGGVDLSRIEIYNYDKDIYESLELRPYDKVVEEIIIEEVEETYTDKELLDIAITMLAESLYENTNDNWDPYYNDKRWGGNPLRKLIVKKIECINAS